MIAIDNRDLMIHHHLGMGDHFICNGLVNYICSNREQHNRSSPLVYIACKKRNLETVSYLYSENTMVIPTEVVDNEISEVNSFVEKNDLNLIRVGFDLCDPNSFDTSFYSQLNIDFIERYRFFKLPKQKPKNLIEVPDYPYILVHDQSSEQKYHLSIQTEIHKLYIDVQEGYHLLSYIDCITNAQEIHCIDSSIFHLIDSLPNITNKLYYHDIRKSPTHFNKSHRWEIVSYD